jgi:alpha-tubulin suppressor-like RCC1 family protein
MANASIQTFTTSGTFTPPAGVTSVTVTPKYTLTTLSSGITGPVGTGIIRTQSGATFSFGRNNDGELGVGDVASRSVPTLIQSLKISKIFNDQTNSEEIGNTFVLDSSGALYGLGWNISGQLGTNDTTSRSSPTLVVGGLTPIKVTPSNGSSVSATFFLNSDGKLYGAGANYFGMLGTNDVVPRSSPTLVVGGLTFTDVILNGTGDYVPVMLSNTGTAYTMGLDNGYGTLGIGVVNTARSSPVAVLGGLTFKQITKYNRLAVWGLTPSGQVYGWGQNNAQFLLGVGDTANRSSPVLLPGGLTFSYITKTGGITTSGDLAGWFYVYTGLPVLTSTPTIISNGITKFSSMVLGSDFGLAISTTGNLYSWGYNSSGQLGNGTSSGSQSSVALISSVSSTKFVRVVANYQSAYAVAENGTIYAWGANNNGQLGLGDTIPRSSPTIIPGIYVANQQSTSAPNFPSSFQISVTPGTAYSVTIGASNSTFGTTPVASGAVDSVAISYNQ